MAFARTDALRAELLQALPVRAFRVSFWDGSELSATVPDNGAWPVADNGARSASADGPGATKPPTFTVRSPKAIAHLLRAPGQLGLSRAYVSGELEVDDLDGVIGLMDGFQAPALDRAARARLALAAVKACGLTLPPKAPTAELMPRGRRHSKERDARAVRHHYDVSNEFFKLFLDEQMVYSCAIFSRGASSLEEAQEAKLDLVCRKLALKEGERVLDVGCGWGAFVMHAARNYGVKAVGITLSEPQAQLARERIAAAGLADRIEVRVADYRDLSGERFDAIASIGMVEHVGSAQIDAYAHKLASLLDAGGRLLNHGIARLPHGAPEAGAFTQRYVFPDAAPLHLSRVLLALERAGFVNEHVEGFARDYYETLSEWIRRLDAAAEQAERLVGGERLRVWRLYLRGARNGFKTGFLSVYQTLARRA
jgi:cyclopropane-fatty-acyl-phospholipid synthase